MTIIYWVIGALPFIIAPTVAWLTPTPPEYLPATSKPSPEDTTAYLLTELWGGGLA
jgi:hypothetical protein